MLVFLRRIYLILFLPTVLVSLVQGQTVNFFRETTNPGYYDPGLGFVSGTSVLKRFGPSGDKLPISYRPFAGEYSLDLSWTSNPGGDWSALVIAPGFVSQNISQLDTLAFWAMSPQGISARQLPSVSMEGAPGATKSLKYRLHPFVQDLRPGAWVQVKVPLSVFFTDPNQTAIQFNQIKAIIFNQDSADQQGHTLYIDEVRAFKQAAGGTAPLAPGGLAATGYSHHIDLKWTRSSSPTVTGYRIYHSKDNGLTYDLRHEAPASLNFDVDYVGSVPTGTSYRYLLTAVDAQGRESAPTSPTQVSTRALSDDDLMEMVQKTTFRYFWDFAHPVSGMSRERNAGDVVTSGGTGFGMMATVVAMERGWITRQEGITRLSTLLHFLDNADRFHGAWSHWLNGTTGDVIPFSQKDNGADLVETSYLVQGMLTVRTYLDSNNPQEDSLKRLITRLSSGVEWNWFRKFTQPFLLWHWSPNYFWDMNMPIRGFNECMITYLLAIAEPTSNKVPPSVYNTGWAGSGYVNGTSYYGIPLAVGGFRGGPLFFSHYSYMGFDPRYWKDNYTNYFIRNRNHTLINRAYCVANLEGHAGYGPNSWGLTASDNPFGYKAHEPTAGGDDGTISPTAALSSTPYTPEFSIPAMRHFYEVLGDRLWGPMGFYDAFNEGLNWYARSYLAIDQGPIINMIENHRTGLLWNQFMANPEIEAGLIAAGFTRDSSSVSIEKRLSDQAAWHVFPNPVEDVATIALDVRQAGRYAIELVDLQGRKLQTVQDAVWLEPGFHKAVLRRQHHPAGTYLLRLTHTDSLLTASQLVYFR